jgi:hypothetical protein
MNWLRNAWHSLCEIIGNDHGYAAIPYIIYAVGTAVSAGGAYYAGQQQKAAQEFNEKVYQRDAEAQKVKNKYEEGLARDRLKRLIGQQRTLYAKAGVDLSSGSPLMVLADTQMQGEQDINMIRYGGDVEVSKSRNRATLARFYGNQAGTSGTLSAIGTAFSGFSKAASGYAGSK